MFNIKMIDLNRQYLEVKGEIDRAIEQVISSGRFIGGEKVERFSKELGSYLGSNYVVTCGNGTDALQLALMALDLPEGSEIIVPAFTYIAPVEVITLLGLIPVIVDVDPTTFCIDSKKLKASINARTKAIIPVHLYGQSCEMGPLLEIANEYDLIIIEDNAQSIGAVYKDAEGLNTKTGTMGLIGCTSFFPTKNLGCYGDGGAINTDNFELSEKIRMLASHGQNKKYHHRFVGINSRLDAIQAAVLSVKLSILDQNILKKQTLAKIYDSRLSECVFLKTPLVVNGSTHTYHQYTLRVLNGFREDLQNHLRETGVESIVYYPKPIHLQEGYRGISRGANLEHAEELSASVLSIPIHPNITEADVHTVCDNILDFFKLRT